MKKKFGFVFLVLLVLLCFMSCEGYSEAVYVFEPEAGSELEVTAGDSGDGETGTGTGETGAVAGLGSENAEVVETGAGEENVAAGEGADADSRVNSDGPDEADTELTADCPVATSEETSPGIILPESDELYEESVKTEDSALDDETDNTEEDNEEYAQVISPLVTEREWSILVYMGADNNLEASALEDLYEMEQSLLNTAQVNVLVLLDRSAQYDTSNGNWSGAKLLKLKTGKASGINSIISEEIDCDLLSIKIGSSVSLDMSSPYVLESALSFMKELYPANHYGLVIWGHGTGWRGEDSELYEENLFKGFAYDDSSQTYMTLKQLGNALERNENGSKLDFLAFDTCFASELEVLYELKDSAEYIVGSEGLLLYSGWNYQKLFDYFQDTTDKSAENLCQCAVQQFSEQFKSSQRASIAAVNTSYISELFKNFDIFMANAGSKITSRTIRDDVLGLLYSNTNCDTERYCYGCENSDVYLDVISAVTNLTYYFATLGISLSTYYSNVKNSISKVVIYSWASDRSDMSSAFSANKAGIGMYFSTLGSNGMLLTVHPAAYIKNKTSEQISFVTESNGYVPSSVTGSSLLDKLFYTSF